MPKRLKLVLCLVAESGPPALAAIWEQVEKVPDYAVFVAGAEFVF